MLTLTMHIPPPARALEPNARVNWRTLAKAKARGKEIAYYVALEALDGRDPPRWPLAEVRVRWFVRDKRGLTRDRDNCIASLKATFDGIAAAGIVENDRGLRIGAVDVEVGAPRELGVKLTITRIEGDVP